MSQQALSSSIFDSMNARSKEVRTEFLGLGVYGMKVVEYKEELSKDKTKALLKVILDTGFRFESGAHHLINVYFNVSGTYIDKRENKERPNIDLFVKFLKECFGIEVFDQIAINKTIGQTIAVATKRDEEGYLGFWFANAIKNLQTMQANYKSKDDSNGKRPERKTENNGVVPPIAPEREPIGFDPNGNPIYS